MLTNHNILLEYEGAFAKSFNREELISAADRIPPLPHTVIKILRLLDDPENDVSHLAVAVTADSGLVAALIKLANSVAFGQAGTVGSTEAAVKTNELDEPAIARAVPPRISTGAASRPANQVKVRPTQTKHPSPMPASEGFPGQHKDMVSQVCFNSARPFRFQ